MTVERPTFHEAWYRVAGLRPRLRATMQTYRQHFRGQTWHVVKDPTNNRHFRLDVAGYHFLGLLDGRRRVDEAWRLCSERLGDAAPTQGEVINVLGQLYVSNLLQSDLPADAAGMFENYRRRVRRQVGGYLMNLLFMRIPLFDPDRLLSRWVTVFGPLFSRPAFAAWAVLVLVGLAVLASRAGDLISGVSGVLAPGNLFLLYLSFAVLKALHELGHGFACRHFGRLDGSGGEVHTMGIMLLVFTPVPYVDASSAWAFRSKWQRAIVGAAGMYVELAIAAVASVVWASTSPGLVHAVAYNLIFVASVSTLLFNGNPLLRFDAYYILSDILEIPNLSNRSRDQFYYLVKRYVYGVRDARSPAVTGGERRWLPTYAVASAIYRAIIFAGIVLFVADKFFFIGALFAIAGIVSWVVVPLGRWGHYLATAPELLRVRGRALGTTLAAAAVVLLAAGVVPLPDRARAEGVVEPRDVALVYVEVDGFIDAVTPSGTRVAADASTLVTATNLELQTRRSQLQAERRLTVVQRDLASLDEPALAQSLTDRIHAIDEQAARVAQQLAALAIRAPIDGVWVAPEGDHLAGAFGRRGDQMGLVATIDDLMIRVIADQRLGPRLAPELEAGAAVEVRVRGRPDLEMSARVESIRPAGSRALPSAALGYLAGGATPVVLDDRSGTRAAEPFFEVIIDPEQGDTADPLLSGQRVLVRFSLPPRPLLAQGWRSLRQLVQRRFQI
jgi:putative peptide zinc metalloprotease protein